VSSISIWELTVKLQLGKLEIDGELAAGIAAQDFEIMPFTAEHAYAVAELPHHHRDPFDRALMAQARSTKMPLVSTDTVIWRYSGQVELLAM
jgi:PIN domain nuclease of toxin-antitoxin system